MDEFELGLVGEMWAYVAIGLVRMDDCPHHHFCTIELERMCKFNTHNGFFDVYGRICERFAVEDLLTSVLLWTYQGITTSCDWRTISDEIRSTGNASTKRVLWWGIYVEAVGRNTISKGGILMCSRRA